MLTIMRIALILVLLVGGGGVSTTGVEVGAEALENEEAHVPGLTAEA
jgi:amino acid permease